jgi:hypothetical protein
MGTVCTVLQWKCGYCNLINSTESYKCINCKRNQKNKTNNDIAGYVEIKSNPDG